MIVSSKELLSYLKAWISGVSKINNTRGFVLPITGGVDSFVCATLCLSIDPSLPVTLVFMGFKEKEAAFYEWVNKNYGQYPEKEFLFPTHPKIDLKFTEDKLYNSSMIGAYLSAVGTSKNQLAVGSLSRSEYSIIKAFKYDIYDCYPLVDLYRGEITELGRKLEIPEEFLENSSSYEKELGVTFDELEWLDRENQATNILGSPTLPTASRFWGIYDQRRKQVVSKIYSIHERVKHKSLPEDKMCLTRKYLPGILS